MKEKEEDILAKNDQSKDPVEDHRQDQELGRRKLLPRLVRVSQIQQVRYVHPLFPKASKEGDLAKPVGEPEKSKQIKEVWGIEARLPFSEVHRVFRCEKEVPLAKAKKGRLFGNSGDAGETSESRPPRRYRFDEYLPAKVMANDDEEDEDAIRHHAAATQIAQLLSAGAAKVANHKQVPATTAPAKAVEVTSPGKVTVPSLVFS